MSSFICGQRFTAFFVLLIATVSYGLDGYVARPYSQRSSLTLVICCGIEFSSVNVVAISRQSQFQKNGCVELASVGAE